MLQTETTTEPANEALDRKRLSDQELDEQYTRLLDRLRGATDPSERDRIKEELARLTFGE